VFNSNGPKASICKWNTNKPKNVTNKMCVKTSIKKINPAINAIKEINCLTALV